MAYGKPPIPDDDWSEIQLHALFGAVRDVVNELNAVPEHFRDARWEVMSHHMNLMLEDIEASGLSA